MKHDTHLGKNLSVTVNQVLWVGKESYIAFIDESGTLN